MADEKVYDVIIRTGEEEEIKLSRYGKVKSLKMVPKAQFQGLFVRKGKIEAWVSQDPRQICTKIMADTPFANVKLLLNRVEGPGSDFWVDYEEKKQKNKRARKFRR